MAERDALQKRYAYHEMSNKVEQADRSSYRSRRSEPTGEVESLRGRTNIGRMGDRIERKSKPTEILEKAKKKQKREEKPAKTEKTDSLISGGQTILDMNVTGYLPSTPGAREAYEKILVRKAFMSFVFSCTLLILCSTDFGRFSCIPQ